MLHLHRDMGIYAHALVTHIETAIHKTSKLKTAIFEPDQITIIIVSLKERN